jgi:hypothetical protein
MTMKKTLTMFEIPPVPIVTGGMVPCVRGQKGKKMGGDRKVSFQSLLFLAAHLFPSFPTHVAHHSAANGVSERNLQRYVQLTF